MVSNVVAKPVKDSNRQLRAWEAKLARHYVYGVTLTHDAEDPTIIHAYRYVACDFYTVEKFANSLEEFIPGAKVVFKEQKGCCNYIVRFVVGQSKDKQSA